MFTHVERLTAFAGHVAAHAARQIWSDRLRTAGGPYRGARHTSSGLLVPASMSSEHLTRDLIALHRPGDAVLDEKPAESGQIMWIIDPLNGVDNYVSGLPSYAVSVAAALDDVVLAGAVAEPHSRRLWMAGLGHGAQLCDPTISTDWLEIRVGSTQLLEDALISTGFSAAAAIRADQAELVARLLPQVADLRCSGAPALELCHVAAGWLTAYVEHDVGLKASAAGLLIAHEAGATVHWPGHAGPGAQLGDPVFAAAPGISDALLEALAHASAASVRRSSQPPPPRSPLTSSPSRTA
ncbi:inositol monophosphatase family protein [Lentzea kentuckyensis]|uniref:inositol monophosphatase family protein n=1 Tax=Lentzea kentuckyensis TaxID=360086 RepID=UPI001179A001|nr:inositol monophosphatase family protein [Lentzea kentuckyensis]